MVIYQPASYREEEKQAPRSCVRQNHPKPGIAHDI